jgi:hypothetical protein
MQIQKNMDKVYISKQQMTRLVEKPNQRKTVPFDMIIRLSPYNIEQTRVAHIELSLYSVVQAHVAHI